MNDINSVNLGSKYRDRVTGFEGTATMKAQFLNGCVRVELSAKVKEAHERPQREVFDIQDLELVEQKIDAEEKKRTGGAREASYRRSDPR